MKKESVYSVIVTCNGSEWIKKCLSSIGNSSIPVRIMIIDNASKDDTVQVIEENFPGVITVKSERNLGFGQANNLGFKRALQEKADFVFLLNQDTWVATDTIEKLVHVAKMYPEYGILSPFHLNYEGDGPEKYFNNWVLQYYTSGLTKDLKSGKVKEIYDTSFVHAACWLMPVATVERVGGFDPLFFHYGEDNDYVQRLHYKGLKVGIVPHAYVFHKGSNDGLANPEENIHFLTNLVLLQLKSPEASDLGAFVLFLRQYVATMRAGNKLQVAAYNNSLKSLISIFRSRRIQKKKMAYLS